MSETTCMPARPRDAQGSAGQAEPRTPRLLDLLRNEIRVRHYSIRTEHAYADWVYRFVAFHGMRHPRDMGAPEINAFLTHLAVQGNVAASTQNQALSPAIAGVAIGQYQ